MFPVPFIQASVVICMIALILFVADYTWLTKGANWRDPIGFTLTIEAVLLMPDIAIALFRWFGPLTPGWLDWEIDTQGTIVLVLGLVLLWRTAVFNKISHQSRKPPPDAPVRMQDSLP